MITFNGVTRHEVHHQEFRYRITPKRSGEIVIPAPVLKVAGKSPTGDRMRLVVLPPSAQDLAIVELKADRQTVYGLLKGR